MSIIKSKKVSIYTLSRELGISPSTVSRAINNHPAVSADVRTKVQNIANKYKYKPQLVVSNRTINITILIQQYDGHSLDFSDFLSEVMEGISQYCSHEELEMGLYSAPVRDLNHCDLVRELRRRNADGVVILRANDQTEYLAQLDDQHFPYLCLFNSSGRVEDRLLTVDEEGLGYKAMDHLLSQGHRKVGILISAPHTRFSERRLQGFRQALTAYGLEFDDRLIFSADANLHKGGLLFGAEGIKTLYERVPEMTACCTICEESARGVLCWLFENNIKVPEQISVVGFDDFSGTAYTCPPLTTIRIPYRDNGYEAARQVHRMCRGLSFLMMEKVKNELSGQLIIRRSTGVVTPKRLTVDGPSKI
jgi:LacI family transcriptional regulator